MHYFDSRRIEMLSLAYMKSDGRVSAAAAVGLLLALYSAKSRSLSPAAVAKLAALGDMPQWRSDFRHAYMELARTRDTDRITAKFQEEVIPQMMKLRPEITKRFQSELPVDPVELEQNPQWQEILDKSGIADRLKEMSEIQEEGGDVMMGTFSQLKSFPFFNDVANWFMPFHADRSEFVGGPQGAGMFADLLADMPVLCDSDKYSMMLTMLMAPAQQRDMMVRQLNTQQEAISQLRAASLNTAESDRKGVFNKVVQNLFRFFRLYRRKGEFPNPFEGAINLCGIKWLGAELADAGLLSLIAEFYFTHRYYQDALDTYGQLLGIEQPTAYVYQKMGYACQKTGRLEQAVGYLEKSEMLDPGSAWALRLLARCYLQLGQYAKAVDALERLETMSPDVTDNALLLGHA
ncbi:MAG: tetratricopeptide repeat protein, partial [Muribaculaceae bacterium]|nr:tetratricopeptide repeat protein [Muribaculaceae bacterium]